MAGVGGGCVEEETDVAGCWRGDRRDCACEGWRWRSWGCKVVELHAYGHEEAPEDGLKVEDPSWAVGH